MQLNLSMTLVLVATSCSLTTAAAEAIPAADSPSLHVRPLTVTPAHTPMVYVLVKNEAAEPYRGEVRVDLPGDWKTVPAVRTVELRPGEATEVGFASEGGVNRAENRYRVTVRATSSDGGEVSREQEIVCASAPYFKPGIDGRMDDWKDAIPVTWRTSGKRTTLRTYWSRRAFSLLVEVEEDERLAHERSGGHCDAVQLAVAPRDALTTTSPDGQAERFEFLLLPTGEGTGEVLQLIAPGQKLAQGTQRRSIERLRQDGSIDGAELVVSRSDGLTRYECKLPMRPMYRKLRPTEGREFQLGLVVHDAGAEGTGPRALGAALGFPAPGGSRQGWSRWVGDSFGEDPPGANRVLWGMCSSKY